MRVAAYTRDVETCALQSGSNGNAIYVEAGGVRLLFDAGITGLQARKRLALHGRDMSDVDALVISHRHGDHARYAGVYQRKHRFPIYMSPATQHAVAPFIGKVHDVRVFRPGERLEFGAVTIHTLATPHDAAESVAFVVEHEGRRLGILTDLGHPFSALASTLEELDAAYLESNYDPEMLACGPYTAQLKARIAGRGGHLSNGEAALLLRHCMKRPAWVALAHLSQQNNSPELALACARRELGSAYPLQVASRYQVSEMLTV